MTAATLLRLYPALAGLSAAELAPLLAPQALVRLPAGALAFTERQPCQGFPLLLEGRLKVIKSAANGREILLYRVEPGDSCIITSSCLLGRSDYSARGVAEADLCLAMLPPTLFHRLLAELPPFRDFVFHLLAERITDLMQLVEEVAFARLDQRLARLLLSRAGPIIPCTHQQLAEELGSVREIVSRLLKGMAEQGLVRLGREQITLLDPRGLAKLAEGKLR
ncbi:MAG: Crp/Fnr family transcriptional regulator [Azovibrio sp.]|nr:Crp/Fnr family transcriptional regulator [Azovibrio sp.]